MKTLILLCLISMLFHSIVGTIESTQTNILALYDEDTKVVFYKDPLFETCFYEFTPDLKVTLKKVISKLPDEVSKSGPPIILSRFQNEFCGNYSIRSLIPLKSEVKFRRKRGVSSFNQGSQTQIQGRVQGDGYFSGQGQAGGDGSQTQIQIGGAGLTGYMSSVAGGSQSRINLRSRSGDGQASTSGSGPSSSLLSLNLGEGREGSSGYASAGQRNEYMGMGQSQTQANRGRHETTYPSANNGGGGTGMHRNVHGMDHHGQRAPLYYGRNDNSNINSGQYYGTTGQQYGTSGQQHGTSGQQYGTSGQQHGTTGQQYGTSGQQHGTSGQQYGTIGQQYGTTGQQYGTTGQQYGTTQHQITREDQLNPQLADGTGPHGLKNTTSINNVHNGGADSLHARTHNGPPPFHGRDAYYQSTNKQYSQHSASANQPGSHVSAYAPGGQAQAQSVIIGGPYSNHDRSGINGRHSYTSQQLPVPSQQYYSSNNHQTNQKHFSQSQGITFGGEHSISGSDSTGHSPSFEHSKQSHQLDNHGRMMPIGSEARNIPDQSQLQNFRGREHIGESRDEIVRDPPLSHHQIQPQSSVVPQAHHHSQGQQSTYNRQLYGDNTISTTNQIQNQTFPQYKTPTYTYEPTPGGMNIQTPMIQNGYTNGHGGGSRTVSHRRTTMFYQYPTRQYNYQYQYPQSQHQYQPQQQQQIPRTRYGNGGVGGTMPMAGIGTMPIKPQCHIVTYSCIMITDTQNQGHGQGVGGSGTNGGSRVCNPTSIPSGSMAGAGGGADICCC